MLKQPLLPIYMAPSLPCVHWRHTGHTDTSGQRCTLRHLGAIEKKYINYPKFAFLHYITQQCCMYAYMNGAAEYKNVQ